MTACANEGLWDPSSRCRGVGGWSTDAGGLIFHCGDTIFIQPPDQQVYLTYQPGRIDEHVYPAGPKRPHPDIAAGDPSRAGSETFEILRSWSWKRPGLDPVLLLGWIGAALLGGALRWRPMIWVTGDAETGKSTLHEFVFDLFGRGIIRASDATAASLWQKLGYSSIPVVVDELEAEADDRQAQKVIALARQAASGGVILRGGADHVGTEFQRHVGVFLQLDLCPFNDAAGSIPHGDPRADAETKERIRRGFHGGQGGAGRKRAKPARRTVAPLAAGSGRLSMSMPRKWPVWGTASARSTSLERW